MGGRRGQSMSRDSAGGSAIGDAGPPVGEEAVTSDEDGFLGGFDSTYEIDVPVTGVRGIDSALGALGGIGSAAGIPQPSTTTLGALREIIDPATGQRAGGYVGSDQWLPVNESPTTIAQLQMMLVEAGLLDPADVTRPGYYDDNTRGAYRDLLTRANAMGSSWENALGRLRQTPNAVISGGGSQRQPFAAEVSNPDDIKYGIRAGFKRALGVGDIPEEKLDAMVRAYQGEQIAAQRSAYGAVEAGGTVTAAPSFETWADMQAKVADPTAYDSRKVVANADYLVRKLQGQV